MTRKIELEKLRIIYYPDPILREVCQPVEQVDDTIRGLVRRMLELMRAQKGIGLAGPQVGVLLRLFVCNPTGEPGDDMVCINPELADLTGAEEREEGCLSLPEVNVPIRRAAHARIKACDETGKPYERDGEDLWARVWQHENDHLDGRLIVDYMSEASHIANRRILKQLQAEFKKSA